jgi:class 3 adenylate cyclase/predicted ATPase
MTFDELITQAVELLQREGRVSYRALKRRFALDDEDLEDLKAELIDAKRLATDEDGKVLVWAGASPVPGSELQVPSSTHPLAERRQLTVMFCDVVGSTALSAQLDPEEFRGVIQAYQQACVHVITRFDGHLAKYLGDGLLVYFGYPTAHEDDATRAVRAGLGIVAAIQQLLLPNIQLPYPLQVRVGIHTGLVVAGEMGSGEYREQLAIVGETPNIAARLQEYAQPDSIVISPTTARLVAGMFECQDLGPQMFKGLSTSLSVYRVIRESEAQSRFEVAVRTGLTPLIGRTHEIGLLGERWERARQGEGQVVLLSGEAGIGKSRLVQELKEQVSAAGATCLAFRCSPYHQNSAFYPIIEHVQRLLQFEREEPLQAKLSKLQQTLAVYRFLQADTVTLIAALLSLPHPEEAPPLTLSPQKQKQKTQEALVAWLVEEAERTPVYCVWEDLHWADPSTVEVLHLLLAQVPTARMLTLLTFRPEFMPPWGPHSHITPLTLSRLGSHDVGEMAEKVAKGKALSQEVLQQIVAKTDGVPLFVEELTKTVLEAVASVESMGSQSSRVLQAIPIPTTLHDALMARLDRMGAAKDIAQVGATLGREFSYEVLHAVSPRKNTELQQALEKLVEAEVLYQRGMPPQATYLFKHALIQDVAYQSLLKSTRQQYHQQIAQILEEKFLETKGSQPELLAHHYTEAGLIEHAIPYWQKAGQRAVQRSANVEAISHLTKGLELLKTLPDTPERIQQELRLHVTLGIPLVATKGFAAPEVEQIYARARELSEQVGESTGVFAVLNGLRSFHMVRGDTLIARALGERLLQLAEHAQDSALLLEAYTAFAIPLYFLGELELGRAHLEQTVALYDPQQHRALAFVMDSGVACRGHLGTLLWILGYPDQAVRRVEEGVELARAGTHMLSLGFALNAAAAVHLHRKEFAEAQRYIDEVITLCHDYGLPQFMAWGVMGQGVIRCAQGHVVEGIEQIERGITIHRATGARFMLTSFLATLARQYGDTGAYHKGFDLIHEDMAIADTQRERLFEADMYRLKGELLLAQESKNQKAKIATDPQSLLPDPQGEAEACFLKAIEIAQNQQAKSLELRASTSLARLWQQQGKQHEAHSMLADIYGWFTEGFDTKDLQEAQALLEELAE